MVATGQPEMVKGEWIKPGAIVIDCGINYVTGKCCREEGGFWKQAGKRKMKPKQEPLVPF